MLSNFQNYVVTLLRDRGGANAVKFALIGRPDRVFQTSYRHSKRNLRPTGRSQT